MDRQNIFNKLKSYDRGFDEDKVNKAIGYAVKHKECHAASLIKIAEIIVEMHLDSNSVIAALLYRVLEETNLTLDEIEQHFGFKVASLVNAVTQLSEVDFFSNHVDQTENLRNLLLTMSEDIRIRVLLIKFLLSLYNIVAVDPVQSIKTHQLIALHIIEIYIPLVAKTGIESLQIELQDFCFNILYPEERSYIVDRLRTISNTEEDMVNKITEALRDTLNQAGIEAIVSGRLKSPYSIWTKMERKNVGLEKLSDIIAFRIIVNNKEECYTILDIIHSNYEAVPEHLNDFINAPKDNGYQSIHTVVIGPFKQNIEIQIRTKEMHDEAEHGAYAHWEYKRKTIKDLRKLYSPFVLKTL